MAEGNLQTWVSLRRPVNHVVVANESTAIQGLAINAAGAVTATATATLGFSEVNLPSPLPAAGEIVPMTIAMDGIVQGISAAAIANGDRLTVTTGGKLQPAISEQFVIGRAMSVATAADQKVQVFITREGNV